MNAKQLIAVVAILTAAGSTFAQSRESVAPDANFTATKSRAEVRTELSQARANGSLAYRNDTYPVITTKPSVRSRAEVRTEVMPSTTNNKTTTDTYFGA